jgi:F0F1-type ATP synthase assembly protein I
MADRVPAPVDATTEAIATTALFLNFTAVIALAVCLASVGMSDVAVATIAGVIAVLSFAASILCFRAQAGERQRQEMAAAQVVPATT